MDIDGFWFPDDGGIAWTAGGKMHLSVVSLHIVFFILLTAGLFVGHAIAVAIRRRAARSAAGRGASTSTAPESTPSISEPTPAPEIRILGPVRLVGAHGDVEPSKRGRLTELAAYIALNSGRNHHALTEAIWPGDRIGTQTRATTVCKLRRWLGHDAKGRNYLPHLGTGYAFLDSVTCDWLQFQPLAERGLTTPGDQGTALLEGALRLVRGQPFSGTDPNHYAWAEVIKQEMIDTIAKAAEELATRHLRARRFVGARKAIAAGMTADPASERLLGLLLEVELAAGNDDDADNIRRRITLAKVSDMLSVTAQN